jgi:hypothetical protein
LTFALICFAAEELKTATNYSQKAAQEAWDVKGKPICGARGNAWRCIVLQIDLHSIISRF